MVTDAQVIPPAALIVIDMTEYATNPHYETALSDANEIVSAIQRMLRCARQHQIPIFFTRGGLTYFLSKHVDLPDFVRGSWLWKHDNQLNSEWEPHETDDAFQIAKSLAPRPHEPVIDKTKPSAFFGTPLHSYLTGLGIKTLFITGVHTSNCVRATVVDAFSYNYRVIMVKEAISDANRDAHEFHIQEMNQKYGWVVEIDRAEKLLQSVSNST